jgi:methylaspartate mutase epsilon subunit
MTQDLATAQAIRSVAVRQLDQRGLAGISTRLVFHQWMGAFPNERIKAESLIVQGGIIAALSKVDKVVVKTRTEALGIPDLQSNSDAVKMTRYAMELCQGSTNISGPDVEEEAKAIESAANFLIEAIINIKEAPLWECIVRGVRRGLIDIPFSPHQENVNKLWTLRDINRNIRVADKGEVPIPTEFFNREKALLGQRLADHSLDGMINDILMMVKGIEK